MNWLPDKTTTMTLTSYIFLIKAMKKLFFALGAVALMGLSTACIDQIDKNPNYDPAKDVVNTQFVLNIATDASNVQTKQTASAVQADGRFRGLNNASLLTFHLDNDGQMITAIDPTENTTDPMTKATSYINLSSLLGPGVIDPTGTNANGQPVPKSRRILNIGLPIGTNTLLFYGQAITGTTEDEKNLLGALAYQQEGLTTLNLNDIGCWAVDRLPENSGDAIDYARIERILETIYNHLFKLKVTLDQDYGIYETNQKEIKWSDYSVAWNATTNQPGKSPIPDIVNYGKEESQKVPQADAAEFEKALAKAYQAFTTIRSGELRSGSGQSIIRQFTDLYTIVYECMESTPVNDLEWIALNMLSKIKSYLLNFMQPVDVAETTINGFRPLTNDSDPGATTVIKSLKTLTGTTYPIPSNTKYTLGDFPFHFNMPLGAAVMYRYTDADATANKIPEGYSVGDFYYSETMPLADNTTMSVYDYTYPPSLVYYGNSPVRISNSNNLKESDYLDGSGTGNTEWQNGSWNSNWLSGFNHVVASTRGVAMAYNIQYGNAVMETKVKYADDVLNASSTNYGLADNNAALNQGDADNVFKVNEPIDPTATTKTYPTLQLTGVLISGQPSKVGWNYMPVSNATFTNMVYDKAVSATNYEYDQTTESSRYWLDIPNTKGSDNKAIATEPNYTLLFDNYGTNNPNPKKVIVCLEFKNLLGKDFWGNANMVREGGTFYLIGTLDASVTDNDGNLTHNVDWDDITASNKILPPYTASETSTNHTLTGDDYLRVFIQDCMTKATFVIGHNSLKNAYVTVPDLRSSKLSFGLSVDLSWGNGIDFGEIPL